MMIADIPDSLRQRLRQGVVIPAHPLALTAERQLDVCHQTALTRYYIDAGVGGIAVGVHTTQFEIRDPKVGLFEPVLALAANTADAWCATRGHEPVLKVAGVCGCTKQALDEARLAHDLGYHACLLSLSAFREESVEATLAHCRQVAEIMPLFGFYLQPAVGGRVLPYSFWRGLMEIENVLAIKIAPFNRYQTLDVMRAVCEAGREADVALYTGNDDNILLDLLTEYTFAGSQGVRSARMVGGLLGHWAVWTRRAVELLDHTHRIVPSSETVPGHMLTLATQITDANAALFDAANGYVGCIAGIHEVLRRQGLMAGIWCLNPKECLSAGQAAEIDRVCTAYPSFSDDLFVAENRERWLA